MRKKLNTLMKTMIDYYEGDPKRIQHFIKVASLAKEIASLEDCDKEVMHLVEATGYVHDIGIRKAEKHDQELICPLSPHSPDTTSFSS